MKRPLLCVTITEVSVETLCAERDRLAPRADLVELRLDAIKGAIDVHAALEGRTKPAIIACRRRNDGGWFDGSEDDRRRLLLEAVHAGAEYVDVEWDASFRGEILEARSGRGVVLSMHDFDGLPADLDARVNTMVSEGSDVVKVAVTPARLSDCLALGHVAASRPAGSIVCVAMGPRGLVTRVLPGRFGSAWTYAGQAAPGQLTLDDLLDLFRFREVTDATAVYAVAGSPVTRSLSPAMHNAWFTAMGFDGVYLPLDTDSVDDLFELGEAIGLAGASITAPLKEPVVHRVDRLDATAQRIGAVNTLDRTDRGWMGANTDVAGFVTPLRERGFDARGKRAAVLGAGGAARAVTVALAELGADVSVYARRMAAARAVAGLAGAGAFTGVPAEGSWDLLVNATPVGSGIGDGSPVPAEGLGPGRLVYDLVSNPPATPLLNAARAAGCDTISGVEMLVAQAELQAERWTGRRPTPGLMKRAALTAVQGGR